MVLRTNSEASRTNAGIEFKSFTHHFCITQIQSVPHKTLWQGIWFLTYVVFICFNCTVRRDHFICREKKTKREYSITKHSDDTKWSVTYNTIIFGVHGFNIIFKELLSHHSPHPVFKNRLLFQLPVEWKRVARLWQRIATASPLKGEILCPAVMKCITNWWWFPQSQPWNYSTMGDNVSLTTDLETLPFDSALEQSRGGKWKGNWGGGLQGPLTPSSKI